MNKSPILSAPAPSAPPITEEKIQEIQNRLNILRLTATTYELNYVKSQLISIQKDLTKTNITKCDEQCQKANQSIESNTVDDFLKKINDIFNK